MIKENSGNYISLMDATKLCDYSQEYLSLRARRGKLKSVKQGRNWVTTKEWLDEYIKKTESYKEELAKKNRDKEYFFKIKTTPFALDKKIFEQPISVFASQGENIKAKAKEKYLPAVNFYESAASINDSLPPDNLPIESIRFAKFNNRETFLSFLKIGFSLGLIFGILIGALIFNRFYFGNLLDSSHAMLNGFSENLAYTGNTFKSYFYWLGDEAGAGKFYGLANGLLPWTSNVLDFNKQSILLLLVSASLFAWLIKSLVSGFARINFNPFLVFIILFSFIYGLAGYFSIYRYGSIWGTGSAVSQSFMTVVALCMFYFLTVSVFRKEEIINMLRLFASSGFLALLYGILQLAGKFLFKFPFAQSANFNTIGSVNELGIFAAVIFPLAIMLAYSSKRVLKGLFIALIISEIIVLMLVNFKFAWLAIAAGAVLIVIFGMQKRDWIGGNKLVAPMFILAISLILIFFNFQMPTSSSRLAEVYLNQRSSLDIVKKTLAEKPILGSGQGTFSYDFAKFKKIEFNNTVLWNATFATAGSKIMNLFAETGVLGILSFLLLTASFLFNGLLFALGKKNILKEDQQNLANMPMEEETDKRAWMVKTGVFASFASLVIFYFFYNSSLTMDFFFFLLIAGMSVFLYPEKKEVALKTSSMAT
ncbi:MAG: hypothetical protein NTW46_02915, partial [Candidatus Nealsonbacteria bacterium]|nr:hypothetical protein [Candidatus Nealsonbacteria bacterium]